MRGTLGFSDGFGISLLVSVVFAIMLFVAVAVQLLWPAGGIEAFVVSTIIAVVGAILFNALFLPVLTAFIYVERWLAAMCSLRVFWFFLPIFGGMTGMLLTNFYIYPTPWSNLMLITIGTIAGGVGALLYRHVVNVRKQRDWKSENAGSALFTPSWFSKR